MGVHRMTNEKRVLAATNVEQAVEVLAVESGMDVTSAVWNRGEGLAKDGPHRLDLVVNDAELALYITDEELESCCHGVGDRALMGRLQYLIENARDAANTPWNQERIRAGQSARLH